MEQRIVESQRLVLTPVIEGIRICEHHVLRQTQSDVVGLRPLDEQATGRCVQDKANLPGCRTEAERFAVDASGGSGSRCCGCATPTALKSSAFGAQRTSGLVDRISSPP